MTDKEALHLIKPIGFKAGEVWADLGAGSGIFTNAIATLLQEGSVHALDNTTQVLERLSSPSKVQIHVHKKDFTQPLGLPPLDGIFIANALHYIRNQQRLLAQLALSVKPNGKLVVLEYDIRRGNPWVPFPVNFEKLDFLCGKAGLPMPLKIASHPSRYHREIYVGLINMPALGRTPNV